MRWKWLWITLKAMTSQSLLLFMADSQKAGSIVINREYLETGEFSAQLAGNAPFIIDKDHGEIHSFGTAYPLDKYLQDYEQQKNT
jgi:hypothetical protein